MGRTSAALAGRTVAHCLGRSPCRPSRGSIPGYPRRGGPPGGSQAGLPPRWRRWRWGRPPRHSQPSPWAPGACSLPAPATGPTRRTVCHSCRVPFLAYATAW